MNKKQLIIAGLLSMVFLITYSVAEEVSEFYKQAKLYYEKAVSSDNPAIAFQLYNKAIKYAQLELESLNHSEEMSIIVTESRKKIEDCENKIRELKSQHKVILGMTKEDVQTARGAPTKTNYNDGKEQYVYEYYEGQSYSTKHTDYYNFNKDGILVSMEE